MTVFYDKTKEKLGWVIVSASAIILLTSSWDDSPSFDEVEHITAGFYNIRTQNYWMNVYHPPLVKDIAGLAVAALQPRAYLASSAWQERQKEKLFLHFFWSNPDAQGMLRLARAPLQLCAIAFLFYFFRRLRNEFGYEAALTGLLMIAFSPTFLAHARFVTTDAPATISFFVCIFLFFDYLQDQSKSKLVRLSIATGLALLVKHSLIALIPFYGLIVCLWVLTGRLARGRFTIGLLFKGLKHGCTFLAISVSILWFGYFLNMMNLPPLVQKLYNKTQFSMDENDPRVLLIKRTQKTPVLRQLSWYLTGLVGQTIHIESGHSGVGYLCGKLYRGGNPIYFPYLIFTKEPLGFLAMVLPAVALTINGWIAQSKALIARAPSLKGSDSEFGKIKQLLPALAVDLSNAFRNNLVAIGSFVFVVLYLAVAVTSQLNLGIRHILPVLPFVYLLTALSLSKSVITSSSGRTLTMLRYGTAACLAFGCISSLLAYPGYLAYFNEIAGGKRKGYYVAIDSNVDWGIDLYRLKLYVERKRIQRLHLFYFGTGNPYYYLDMCYVPWSKGKLPPGEYFAVSTYYLAQAAALNKQSKEFRFTHTGRLQYVPLSVIRWLLGLKPIAVVGDSIFVYRIPEDGNNPQRQSNTADSQSHEVPEQGISKP